jgi:hypothetical protein
LSLEDEHPAELERLDTGLECLVGLGCGLERHGVRRAHEAVEKRLAIRRDFAEKIAQ